MTVKRRSEGVKPASSEEALAFVRDLQEKFLKPDRSRADDRLVRTYLAGEDPERLRSIASRVMIDVLKGPQSVETTSEGARAAPAPRSPPDGNNKPSKRGKASSVRKPRPPTGSD
ncbi:MAG: hypothetical protein ABI537_05100 [Casimicrobiaceae bacterium]